MEILLAMAVMAVAVASWFVASAFNTRIRENTAQLGTALAEIRKLQQAVLDLDRRAQQAGTVIAPAPTVDPGENRPPA
ncbi:MAG TPA: hypothetical protein VGI31_09165 [Streptosporangiaceae bacterium]